MKYSTLVAIIACLAAIVGALATATLYLKRREKELDEYEELLFSEDFADAPEETEGEDYVSAPLEESDEEV